MTAAEAMNANFEEKRRVEKINGVTVMQSAMPSVNHNRVVGNIVGSFFGYLKGKQDEVFENSVQVHLDEDNTFVPDAMIVCNKDIIKHNGIYGAPDLVVEVLSPSTGKNDRGPKKDVYEKTASANIGLPIRKANPSRSISFGTVVLYWTIFTMSMRTGNGNSFPRRKKRRQSCR